MVCTYIYQKIEKESKGGNLQSHKRVRWYNFLSFQVLQGREFRVVPSMEGKKNQASTTTTAHHVSHSLESDVCQRL